MLACGPHCLSAPKRAELTRTPLAIDALLGRDDIRNPTGQITESCVVVQHLAAEGQRGAYESFEQVCYATVASY